MCIRDRTVPASQSFGYVYIDFVADPEEEISEDGNRSNNNGVFVLYIGALPMANLIALWETLTLDEVSLDGSGSHDPDGGTLECEFRVERANGQIETALEDDCVYEWSWIKERSVIVRFSSKIHYAVAFCRQFLHKLLIYDVPFDKAHPIVQGLPQIGQVACIGQFVHHNHCGRGICLTQVVNKIAANKACATCHQD